MKSGGGSGEGEEAGSRRGRELNRGDGCEMGVGPLD